LGDSVLGFVVSAWLLERFPDLSEGKLSKMKAYLVSESRLVEIAEALDLGSYILLNRGEEKTGGRRKRALLADAYEALIGVIYMDGGITVAERFLRRELRQKLMSIDPGSMIGADFKSALQEKLQAAGGPGPDYVVVDVQGPDHRRTFRVQLRIGGRAVATGEGHTIKLAQQEAARSALESPNDLLRFALRQTADEDNEKKHSDLTPANQPLRVASLGEESASSSEVYVNEDPDDAADAAAGSTPNGPNRLTELQVGSRNPQLKGAANGELSAEPEGDFEVRSVSGDI
jgi:ribonuclease-3